MCDINKVKQSIKDNLQVYIDVWQSRDVNIEPIEPEAEDFIKKLIQTFEAIISSIDSINDLNTLMNIQETIKSVKADTQRKIKEYERQERKPVKKARSIHAEKHSGTIDRLSKIVFEQPEKLADRKDPSSVRTDPKGKLIVKARLAFDNLPNVILPQSLADPFNRAVFDSALSLFLAGNTHFTAESIYYEMTGNNSRSRHPNREILKDIVNAIEILMHSWIFIDATKEAEAKGYNFKETKFESLLLPLDGLHVVLMNGVQVDAYEFLKEPVLYSYAHQKGQVLDCNIDTLSLPESLYMTRDNVILQRYLIERIERMKNPHNHNKNKNVIRYEAIYELLGIQETSREYKRKTRDKVKKFLDNWKDLAYIKDYHEEKNGQFFYSISIDIEPKKIKS